MYYYAQYDTTTYAVSNVISSDTEITTEGYVAITEEQYTNGGLVGKFYNPITGNFDEQRGWVCDTSYVQYKTTNATLGEKLDAMDGAIEGKAAATHTHADYANVNHNHDTEYADINHTHAGVATSADIETLETALAGKAGADHTHDIATETASGLMSYADKEKLNDIEAGANNYTHPANHSADMITGLSAVATSGNYNDLTNKPAIPEQYTHPESHPASMISGLSEVATSGSYNDLSDKPTIPTTLPANGGNADTVDGKHAVDFATADHNHDSDYADIAHTHSQYATNADVEALETTVNGKANASHAHAQSDITGLETALSGKADADHTHANYVTNEDFSELETTVNGKANANHTHTQYASVEDFEALETAVDGKASASHTHTQYSETTHTHADKANVSHTHAQDDITGLSTALSGKANSSHTHEQSEITGLASALNGKSDTTHSHTLDEIADTEGYVRMTSAERTKLSGIATGANKTTVDSSLSSTSTNPVQNKVVNTALSGKANSSHTHSQGDISGLATALSGKANTSHTHAQSEVTGLATTLDGKVDKVDGKALSTNDYTTAEKNKLAGIAAGANAYTHPAYTAKTAGLYKVTVDSKGHVSGATAVTKADITALGIPAQDTNTTYGNATTSAAGLMSTADKSKLDGIATGANKYTHPAYTAKSSGLYKVTVDSTGHVSATTAVAKSDITALGIPAQDTTYSAATTSAAGLMSASDKSKLDGIATGANKYTHPSTHPASMITGLSTVATSGSYNDLSNKPTSMTPTAHTHGIGDITALSNELANKAPLNSVEVLEAGTNLNNYTTAGMYSFSVSSAPLNMPAGCTNGWLIVIPWSAGSNTIKQFFLRHGTPNSTDHFTYTRMYTSAGGWSDWSTYYTTSNPPTAAEVGAISTDLLFTNSEGGVEYSYGSGSGKNVLTEISNMPQGFHTIYAIAGTAGNPETTESYRYFIHKTSSTIGWIYAFGADGSIYSNYQSAANTFKGWKTIHDAKRKPLWTGSYYMTAGHTVTPSKKLSQCEHGWMLLWSDYDPDTGDVNNTDFCTTIIPNRNWTGGTWNGAAYYCDCPRYTAGTATDSESRVIKVVNVYDNKLVGVANNNAAPRNDVVLRAVYEF